MRRFVTVVAVTLAALATPAFADQLSRSIPITQAERQDPAAAAALYSRVTTVAKTLCAKLNEPQFGYGRATSDEVAACERHAVANAISSVDLPVLAQIHTQALTAQGLNEPSTTIAAR